DEILLWIAVIGAAMPTQRTFYRNTPAFCWSGVKQKKWLMVCGNRLRAPGTTPCGPAVSRKRIPEPFEERSSIPAFLSNRKEPVMHHNEVQQLLDRKGEELVVAAALHRAGP